MYPITMVSSTHSLPQITHRCWGEAAAPLLPFFWINTHFETVVEKGNFGFISP